MREVADKWYGLVIDLERCVGCHTCTVACKVENGMEAGSGIRVETIGGGRQDTPSGRYPGVSMHFRPVACMHCQEPPCRDACPAGAISCRPDGIVLLDEGLCNGCQACLPSCPYGALACDEETSTVRKCNLCSDRLDEGFEPFCVLCCGNGAISFGDLADADSSVSRLVSQRGAGPLKPELGTRPSVFYCQPGLKRTTSVSDPGIRP